MKTRRNPDLLKQCPQRFHNSTLPKTHRSIFWPGHKHCFKCLTCHKSTEGHTVAPVGTGHAPQKRKASCRHSWATHGSPISFSALNWPIPFPKICHNCTRTQQAKQENLSETIWWNEGWQNMVAAENIDWLAFWCFGAKSTDFPLDLPSFWSPFYRPPMRGSQLWGYQKIPLIIPSEMSYAKKVVLR